METNVNKEHVSSKPTGTLSTFCKGNVPSSWNPPPTSILTGTTMTHILRLYLVHHLLKHLCHTHIWFMAFGWGYAQVSAIVHVAMYYTEICDHIKAFSNISV